MFPMYVYVTSVIQGQKLPWLKRGKLLNLRREQGCIDPHFFKSYRRERDQTVTSVNL